MECPLSRPGGSCLGLTSGAFFVASGDTKAINRPVNVAGMAIEPLTQFSELDARLVCLPDLVVAVKPHLTGTSHAPTYTSF